MKPPSQTIRPGIMALGLAALLSLFGACDREEGKGGGPTAAAPDAEDKMTLRIVCSRSALPLIELLVREAEGKIPGLKTVFLPAVRSDEAAAAVHAGDADFGVLSRLRTRAERKYDLRYLHLARDALVFATHRSVRVANLSRDQIRGIYSGEITNWKAVGGNDLKIVVLDRPEHSAPRIALRSSVFHGALTITDKASVLEHPSMMRARLENEEGSIGYLGLSDILSHDLVVDILRFEGILPTPEKTQRDLYPLGLPMGLVLKPKPRRIVMRFVDFVASDRGREVLSGNGFSHMEMSFAIATIPERNIFRQEERYRPLMDYLSRRLGRKARIELRHLPKYEDVVRVLLTGGANAAFIGSFTYVMAQAELEIEPLVRPEKDGVSSYRGLIFTRKDSGIKSWEDLEGRSFAMIRNTTAGELFPKVYLKRQGVQDVDKFLGKVDYVGNHDISILKVLNREVDAGAAKDLIFEALTLEDPRLDEDLVVLAKSEAVPENALVVRKDIRLSCFRCHQLNHEKESGSPREVELDLKARLRKVLLSLDDTPEGRKVLRDFGADRFVATSDADYQRVYEIVRELGLDLKRR